MVADLEEIRRLAAEKEAENLEFRRYIEAHHPRPHLFVEIAREVEKQVDCTKCANCCRATRVDIAAAELTAIAGHLGMVAERVEALYTETDPRDRRRVLRQEGGKPTRGPAGGPEGPPHLAQEGGECAFLDGNLCMIYDARPKACRDFPHIDHEETSLGGRMSSACRNARLCPIVYNAIEEMKRVTGFHARGH